MLSCAWANGSELFRMRDDAPNRRRGKRLLLEGFHCLVKVFGTRHQSRTRQVVVPLNHRLGRRLVVARALAQPLLKRLYASRTQRNRLQLQQASEVADLT
jgi:hypothetical protein